MGLDTVELVMAVEEHFGIEIPNDVASELTTVGRLLDFVVSELQRLRHQPVDTGAIFTELRDLICEQAGVTPEQVVLEASFVDDLRMD